MGGKGTGPTRGAVRERGERLASLHRDHARTVVRIASRRAHVPGAVMDDACQTAWMRLCEHDEVALDDERGIVAWLVTTAVREVWRGSRCRETAVGAWQTDTDVTGELQGAGWPGGGSGGCRDRPRTVRATAPSHRAGATVSRPAGGRSDL